VVTLLFPLYAIGNMSVIWLVSGMEYTE
jgi:hypothetical protein